MAEGSVVYLLVKSKEGTPLKIAGRLVECKEESAVVAVNPKDVDSVEQTLTAVAPGGGRPVAFVRVPASSFSSARPEGWGAHLGKKVPDQATCWASWGELAKEVLVSSEAEKPKATAAAASSKKVSGLQEDLANLSRMFDPEDPSSSDSDSDTELLAAKRSKNKSGHLPPGGLRGAAASSQSRKPSDRPKDPDMAKVVKNLMMKGMTEGQSPSELLPYMMMSMMLDQKEKSKHRRRGRRDQDSPGGSSSESSASDDSDHKSGMRAVTSLHKLQKKITRHPKSIVKDFERQVVEELGVVEGQCWTLMDYVKRQQWGKFRGIYRCACMDVRAYELLRGGQTEAAQAQLIQNLKAKIQSVIQGGSWETAWLLTGIADPLSRREFGGSKEEMSVVSEYVNQLAKLKKRVKEASHQDKGGADEEDEGAHRSK